MFGAGIKSGFGRGGCAAAVLAICGMLSAASTDIAGGGETSRKALALYVSLDGNDAWSGRLPAPNAKKTDGPLATLAGARDALRKARESASGLPCGATVYVREGVYSLPATFKLESRDSGTAAGPIVYRAHQGERAVLSGAKPLTGFTTYKGQILKTDVASQGLKGVHFRQLFFDGRRQHLARYPNHDPQNPYGGGWAYADGKPIPMYQDAPGESRRELTCKVDDARHWSRPTEGEVFVFARYNWWNNIVRIKSLDAAARKITLVADASYPIRPRDRYYVRNLFEELDSPGEWWLDRESATLYFWPPSPLSGRPVYAPHLRTIVEFGAGASYVTLRGFTIENCEGTGVVLKDCQHCLIAGNTIRNLGDYSGAGVSVSGGQDNGVAGNDIYEIGSSGVGLSGGDRPTLAPANNYADNNYIHHIGVFYKQGVGVSMHGVGNRASHNLIHDGPRMGIMFGGNNLVIEYNHIRHMNLETEDTGAVYTGGRDWISSRGTAIRYNYFHDILGYGQRDGQWVSPFFAWGVYLDDNTGGVDVIGNLIVRTTRAGIHLHNGRDNLIRNNVIVEGGQMQVEYNGWNEKHRYWTNHLGTMVKGYESVAGQPAWKNMRHMDLHPTKAVLPDGTIMSGNTMTQNIIAYQDPKAKLYSFRTLSWDVNPVDRNLIWHAGLPLATSVLKVRGVRGPNLVANADFEEGKPGKTPDNWRWQINPLKYQAQADADAKCSGTRSLRITAGPCLDAKGKQQTPPVVSDGFPVKQGQTYRLTARCKTDLPELKAALGVQSYIANVYFWYKSAPIKTGADWREAELIFKIPTPGESGYNEKMTKAVVRLDFSAESGSLWVDQVCLQEADVLNEWEAWQALGQDVHSVVADPGFVDPSKDDYRLRPDSPALKLGFKPLPIDKMGPYADPLRATWPIVEAEGAREKPLK